MLNVGDSIAILGGAGALGTGLARRWAQAGFDIILGTRDVPRGKAAADAINARVGAMRVSAASNEAAAAAATLSVLTVPFTQQGDLLVSLRPALAGKVLIDCTAPLLPPKVGTVRLPAEGSAAQRGQTLLGEEVIVVSAFQNIGAALLQGEGNVIDCDVLICSDDPEARRTTVQLAQAAGLRGLEAGPLANAAAAEALTSILITINRRYKADHAGIRITGIPRTPQE